MNFKNYMLTAAVAASTLACAEQKPAFEFKAFKNERECLALIKDAENSYHHLAGINHKATEALEQGATKFIKAPLLHMIIEKGRFCGDDYTKEQYAEALRYALYKGINPNQQDHGKTAIEELVNRYYRFDYTFFKILVDNGADFRSPETITDNPYKKCITIRDKLKKNCKSSHCTDWSSKIFGRQECKDLKKALDYIDELEKTKTQKS